MFLGGNFGVPLFLSLVNKANKFDNLLLLEETWKDGKKKHFYFEKDLKHFRNVLCSFSWSLVE